MALITTQLGRPFDRVLVGLHIPAVICWIGIIAAAASGSFQALLKHRVGIVITAALCWLLMCCPFSSWKGGSVTYVAHHVAFRVVLFLVVAAAPRHFADLRKLVFTTAAVCVIHFLTAGTIKGDRLAASGSWGNSDDVALMAGFVLPLWLFGASVISPSLLRIPALLGGGVILLRSFGLSGTRAGILGMLCMIGVYFLRSSGLKRFLIVIGTFFLGGVFLLTLPTHIRSRLATIVDMFDEEALQTRSEAMASVNDRKELLGDAIRMTREHPVFGVGPGRYGQYRWENYVNSAGMKRRWFPSHNTYLQISSETGIPGLLLYLALLGSIYATILAARKASLNCPLPDADIYRRAVLAVELSLVYFAVCAFFMTCDAHPHLYILAGIAVGLDRVIRSHAAPPQQPSGPAALMSGIRGRNAGSSPSFAGLPARVR